MKIMKTFLFMAVILLTVPLLYGAAPAIPESLEKARTLEEGISFMQWKLPQVTKSALVSQLKDTFFTHFHVNYDEAVARTRGGAAAATPAQIAQNITDTKTAFATALAKVKASEDAGRPVPIQDALELLEATAEMDEYGIQRTADETHYVATSKVVSSDLLPPLIDFYDKIKDAVLKNASLTSGKYIWINPIVLNDQTATGINNSARILGTKIANINETGSGIFSGGFSVTQIRNVLTIKGAGGLHLIYNDGSAIYNPNPPADWLNPKYDSKYLTSEDRISNCITDMVTGLIDVTHLLFSKIPDAINRQKWLNTHKINDTKDTGFFPQVIAEITRLKAAGGGAAAVPNITAQLTALENAVGTLNVALNTTLNTAATTGANQKFPGTSGIAGAPTYKAFFNEMRLELTRMKQALIDVYTALGTPMPATLTGMTIPAAKA